MKGSSVSLITLPLLACCLSVSSQEAPATPEVLGEVIQRQQAEIDELKRQVGAVETEIAETNERIQTTEAAVTAAGDFVESLAASPARERRTSVGGYGELHYNNLEAEDPSGDLREVDLHRFVLFVGHEFSDRIRFFSELEVEHSVTGEGAPGEVEIEQAFVDFGLTDTMSARAGLFLVPVGILNETHEPPTFFGVERNDVESIIIPATWWEAGGGMNGSLANGLSWNVAAHSGLAIPTAGSNAFRVRSGRQKVAEASASDLAYTLRLKYTGRPGLELSASYQYQSDPSQMPGDGLDTGRLFTAHTIYQHGGFGLRALYGTWSFDGATVETAGDQEQSGWFIEPNYKISDRWGVYARYEDVDGARDTDQFTQSEAGFNYWPVPNVVVKFDYRNRELALASQSGRDFDGFDVGVGYEF